MRSSDVTADILNVLSDGQVHSLQEIANEIEVSRITVQRHVASLSYRYPIVPVFGRGGKQGVQLEITKKVNGRVITNDKLQIIGKALRLLQESNCSNVDEKLLNELIREFATPTQNKEEQNEIQSR